MTKNQDLYSEAKKLIPGGTQLLSKRPEMFLPNEWVNYYTEAKGCEVFDLEGRKYTDMISAGIGTCALGFADDDVNAVVKKAVDRGSMSSLNCCEEVELARLLTDLHPWSEMVRFTRCGGEALSVAVRIARAFSGKDKVLFCGYHGWHDWYISSNLASDKSLDGHLLPGLKPSGIPRQLLGTSVPFNYNNVEEFLELSKKYEDDVAAVVLETVRNSPPNKDFIDAIRKFTAEKSAVFIVDEVTSGFRLNVGGAHLIYNIEPDIAVFAKAMSNGYPMAAVVGKRKVMQAAQDSFISSTYWTERIGPTAALATIEKMKALDVPAHLVKAGKAVQDLWKEKADKYGIQIAVEGIYPLGHFQFLADNPLLYKTVFTKFMLSHGFLASTLYYASYAHKDNHIQGYADAVDETFSKMCSMSGSEMMSFINGNICHSGFKRLN
ncbi:MAG: aminotransferase class III-fold pyridoxal phosphate-dependent enzyme [Holosporaceae bacterium]|jgi:glutamate-1-semialdehyde aminotransferase|nr:aminotransferase class III-fold pyridoxal phosphate-dependent enzyme [Holosporaceae bacterium]